MDQWNPATDTIIAQTYDENSLDDRIKNKLSMQEEFNLAVDPRMPLFAMQGRMSQQKALTCAYGCLKANGRTTLGRRLFWELGNVRSKIMLAALPMNSPIASVLKYDTTVFLPESFMLPGICS